MSSLRTWVLLVPGSTCNRPPFPFGLPHKLALAFRAHANFRAHLADILQFTCGPLWCTPYLNGLLSSVAKDYASFFTVFDR